MAKKKKPSIKKTLQKVAKLALPPFPLYGAAPLVAKGLFGRPPAPKKGKARKVTTTSYKKATQYAAQGQIPFDEPYWRKLAEQTWGTATAQELAQLASETAEGKRSATENLNLALERIGQDRAFGAEDLQATLQELASERKWNRQELEEIIEDVTRTQQYLREDFDNTVQELAYQRGIERERIATEIMPAIETAREEAWARGLGAKGLGAARPRELEKARVTGITRAAEAETMQKEKAKTIMERGITEQYKRGHLARLAEQRAGEEIGGRESAAQRAYNQALARYGLQARGEQIGAAQQLRGVGLQQGRAQREAQQKQQIGIEEFVQARKGEAYQRAGAYPERNIYRTATKRVPITKTRVIAPSKPKPQQSLFRKLFGKRILGRG